MSASASGSSALPALLIEAFADAPCRGNGAAVVRLSQAADAAWMGRIARSLRQSETAFVLPWGQDWLLRWFTPTCEVDLCGHATLAALLALGHWEAVAAGDTVRFHTRSGALPVQLAVGQPPRGAITLPSSGLQPAPAPEALQRLLRGRLGSEAEAFWRSPLGYAVALLPQGAPLAGPLALAPLLDGQLRQGLVLMQALADPSVAAAVPISPGAAAAAAPEAPRLAGERPDYQLRFFAPGLGIDEDPVTGSAHALVAPWWMERLGRSRVVGWQCSDRPGGMVCEAASSGMIRLIGTGHLLWDGSLHSAPPPSALASAAASDPSALSRLGWSPPPTNA